MLQSLRPARPRAGSSARLHVECLEDRLTPANPGAVPDSYATAVGQALTATAAQGVLTNDTSAGSSLQARALQGPAHGTLNFAPDGSFVYTPDAGYTGTDEFFYTVSDSAGGGLSLYSIDAETDQLVEIDRDTGTYRVVGNIGYDMRTTDLAVLGDVIYAATFNGPTNPAGYALVGIDPRTGAKTSVVQLSTGTANTLSEVDGLAVVNGDVLVSYTASGLTTVNIGRVDLSTGVITLIQGFGGNQDFDGLGATASGELYNVDTAFLSAPQKQIIFERVTLSPPSLSFVRDDVVNDAIVSDLSFTPFGLYAYDPGSRQLLRYNATTFVREAIIPLGNNAASFSGIDWATAGESIGRVTITVGDVPPTPPAVDATTAEDTQSGAIVVSAPSSSAGPLVTHFKITNIQNGALFLNNGTTPVPNNSFITAAQGAAGLKFTPAPNFTGVGSFDALPSLSASDAGLGDRLYATDATNDRLVTIDRTTGAVATVGSLGFNISGESDLTYFNGAFYTSTFNGAWTIAKIDALTGAAVSTASIFYGTLNPAINVDGLEARGGKLLIVFGYGNGTPSAIGEIDPTTGAITNVIDYDALGFGDQDFDGIAAGETGPLYAIDTRQFSAPLKQLVFQQITFEPSPDNFFIRDAVLSNAIVLDIAVSASAVYAIDTGRRELQRYNRNTFALEAQASYGGGPFLSGLAVVTAPQTTRTFTINVTPVADRLSVTGATTTANTQTTSGLVITRSAADGEEVTHVKVTNILSGTLFLNDGTTPVTAGTFLTVAQTSEGLRFTPATDFTGTAAFNVQASIGGTDAGLGGTTVAALIIVNPVFVPPPPPPPSPAPAPVPVPIIAPAPVTPYYSGATMTGSALVLQGSGVPGGSAVIPLPQGATAFFADVNGDGGGDVVLFLPGLIVVLSGQSGQPVFLLTIAPNGIVTRVI